WSFEGLDMTVFLFTTTCSCVHILMLIKGVHNINEKQLCCSKRGSVLLKLGQLAVLQGGTGFHVYFIAVFRYICGVKLTNITYMQRFMKKWLAHIVK
uniref:Uncharacterized protein n=1 Tax=Amphimedon queenslandica TaxID=400682 RepID=A0A1X7UAE8_AMPQE